MEKMRQPVVTVLVTVKDGVKTIEKCVRSLMKLDYKNYTVYVTDAYSTDGTWEILKKLKKKYGKKLKIEQVEGNIAKAHNYMLRKVKTPYVAFTDADCVVDKNWLKELIKGFDEKDVIATAGYCATPKKVNNLQRLLGMELESRFKRFFGKYITRAPTMNLCVKTKFARKVMFDERLDAAQETDFGWRLTKLGKMKYIPTAIVWHYHRPTLKSYFKQHYRYGKSLPLLYLKHPLKAKGDHISTPFMMFQEYLFVFVLLTGIATIFSKSFVVLFGLSILALSALYIFDITSYCRKPSDMLYLIFLYLVRNVGWTLGCFVGVVKVFVHLVFHGNLKNLKL